MHDIDLTLLRSFVAVVDTGSFTAAAERVHRTQSTVSQQIRKLEERFGCALLERSTSGVTPTELGEKVISYARRLLSVSAELASAMNSHSFRQLLRLGVTDDYAQIYLTRLLDSCKQTLPHVKLSVTCDLSIHLRQGVERGDYDLVLYKRTTHQGKAQHILAEPMLWVAKEGYETDPSAGLDLILFQQGCVYRQKALSALDALSLPWRIAFESPSTVSVQSAVCAGLGIAVLTPSSIPAGCSPVSLEMPRLGEAELVYEFGEHPSAEAKQLLQNALSLMDF